MKYIYILLLVSAATHAGAQSLSPHVIASGGGYFASAGHSLSWTAGETITATFSSVNNILSQGFQQPELDLLISGIDTFCTGLPLDIPFYATGFIGQSLFTAQLSDSAGSFTSPVNIGSATTSSSDTISAVVPGNLFLTNNYRIRIVSTLPSRMSATAFPVSAVSCPVDLVIGLYIEGFYNSGGVMTSPLYNSGASTDTLVCDSVTVALHYDYSPFNEFYSEKVVLEKDGSAFCLIPGTAAGSNYYISIRGRNSIETWSKFPVAIGLNNVYDFRY